MSQQVGVVGMGVMGLNLALNIGDHGYSLAVYNRTQGRVDQFLAAASEASADRSSKINAVGTTDLAELVGMLERPRRIILMIKAGAPVDAVIGDLMPLLDDGDMIVDAGNSLYRDTARRAGEVGAAASSDLEIRFVGMGVSGGEEGARHGPSIMPGGSRAAYEALEELLLAIAAESDTGPCVTYCGAGAAGHFVKMVHNGIEYGDMQLICESYDLLRNAAGLSSARLAETFGSWNEGALQSYLIEITADIVAFPDDRPTPDPRNQERSSGPLIDRILDIAGHKGTGVWAAQAALELGVPVPTIAAAVEARFLSARKTQRVEASAHFPQAVVSLASADRDGECGEAEAGSAVEETQIVEDVRQALYVAKICSYAQGFDLLTVASEEYEYGVDLAEVARIWKAGCIIRAAFLDDIRQAFAASPPPTNLLLAPHFAEALRHGELALRRVVAWGARSGVAVPAFAASLAYFDSYRRARLPANLLQAMRDYFGAHTYQRTDREGTFHTQWM